MKPSERSSFGEHVVEVLTAVGWGLRRSYTANARATVGLFAVALVRSLTPAGIALTGGGLINAAVASSGSGDYSTIVPWLCGGLALALLDALTPFAHKLLATSLQEEITDRATCDLLDHVGRLDFGVLDAPQAGDAVERARQGALGPVAVLVVYLSNTGAHGVQIVSTLAILAHLQPAALLLIAPFAIPYAALRWRTARSRHAAEVSRTAKRRWMAYFVSHLASPHGLIETRLLGLAPLFVERYRTYVRAIRDGERRALLVDVAGASLFATLTTIVFYLVFARVVWLVVQGGLTLGDIAIFLAVSSRLRLALEYVISDASFVVEQALLVAHLRAFLQGSTPADPGRDMAPVSRRGELELDDVDFTYPGADAPVLTGVSLRVAPGEVVALVGANGAGKTTLVKLIARLYHPDAGTIRLDGLDLREWPVDALRASIGFLPQSSARYEATAGENIAFGDWNRLARDPEAVRDVARAARADDLIESLPEGFETLLGPMFGSHDLSGGEWQKLAMARTLARDTCLLMLDEPSSHLDAQAEDELFRGIRTLARGRTTILISHRLSMVGLADRILVLDGGRIVENGTHEELMAVGGLYAALFLRNRARPRPHDEAECDSRGVHVG